MQEVNMKEHEESHFCFGSRNKDLKTGRTRFLFLLPNRIVFMRELISPRDEKSNHRKHGIAPGWQF